MGPRTDLASSLVLGGDVFIEVFVGRRHPFSFLETALAHDAGRHGLGRAGNDEAFPGWYSRLGTRSIRRKLAIQRFAIPVSADHDSKCPSRARSRGRPLSGVL